MEETNDHRIKTQDSHLLELEIDTIFGLNYNEPNYAGAPPTLRCKDLHAIVIWSESAYFVATSPAISSDHRQDLTDQVSTERFLPCCAPRALEHLGVKLGLSPVNITGGPTYIVPSNVHQPIPSAIDGSSLFIISSVSESEVRTARHKLQRPSNWELDDWRALTEGRIGPCAMAIIRTNRLVDEVDDVGLEAVCICFSARRVLRAAEAGIWTREDHRGKRLAPAVVATWAAAERLHKDILFYSTSSNNLASQSVARQLGLQPLGWVWKLHV